MVFYEKFGLVSIRWNIKKNVDRWDTKDDVFINRVSKAYSVFTNFILFLILFILFIFFVFHIFKVYECCTVKYIF